MTEIKLTRYQLDCLRRAFEEHSYLMLPHEPALRRLTEVGFVTADRENGVVWIMPTPAGFGYLCRHPRSIPYPGVLR
jgi:hypothetical protein